MDKACEALARVFFQVTAAEQPMLLVSRTDLCYLVVMASLWAEHEPD